LRLNKKGNKDKEKTVKEKEESGMKTALNVFQRGDRERRVRGKGGRGGRKRGVGADSTQTPNTTQSKPPTTTQYNSTNSPPPQQIKLNKIKCWNCEEEEHGVWDCLKDLKQSVRIRMKKAQQRKLEREEKRKIVVVEVARSTLCMAWWIRHILENQQLHLLFNLKIL
jgi:hypothetical protein